MPLKHVVDVLSSSQKFLITAHVDPEPDALGSELAVYELLLSLGKDVTIVNSEEVPAHYMFLEGVRVIKSFDAYDQKDDVDVIVALDSPTPKRTGKVSSLFPRAKTIINIDHHVSNEKFGTVNWVQPDASSTAEMVYYLYKEMGRPISKKVAFYIYIAILTDTGSFNYSNTSSVTHEIVSELLGYGISPHVISNYVYESKAYSDVKLLGKVLTTLSLKEDGKIAILVCTNKMLENTGSSISATQEFVNFARSLKGVIVSMFIREEPKCDGCYKVSLRSKGDVSVNNIASAFGGGGHKYAAGCVIEGSLAEVKKRLVKKAAEALRSVDAVSAETS